MSRPTTARLGPTRPQSRDGRGSGRRHARDQRHRAGDELAGRARAAAPAQGGQLHRDDGRATRGHVQRWRLRNAGHPPGRAARVSTRAAAPCSGTAPTSSASSRRCCRTTGVKATEQYTVALNGFSAKLTAVAGRQAGRQQGRARRSCPTAATSPTCSRPRSSSASRARRARGPRSAARTRPARASSSASSTPASGRRTRSSPARPVRRTTPGGVGSTYLKDGAIHVVKKDGGEFVGACQAGEQFYATTCNSKLVGARFYADGFTANVPAELRGEHEFLSPRDGDGHGSHTSSTAVGNAISGMNVSGRQFGAVGRHGARPPSSPRTRSAGTARTTTSTAASPRTCSRRSTTPSPTVSTSSTSPSAAARRRARPTRSRSRSSTRPRPASSSRPRPATAAPAPRRSVTTARG